MASGRDDDDGGGVSSSEPLNGGANTVAGNGTERSSPESALVSVPVQGVAPTGAEGAPACVCGNDGSPVTGTDGEEDADGAEDTDAEDAEDEEAAPESTPRPSETPNLSAASCNHSGGDNKNDV
ncbi:hypothetical protein ALMP_02240 [Streptomyces sp. A012304]|nr:hypothetical protein ALMP_02240 [Streptomyces sp. A012304]